MEEESKSQSVDDAIVTGLKRSRETSPELESIAGGDSSPETKRLREELLLDNILDDSSDASTAGDASAGGDLASFMKSFEEEIAFSSGSSPAPETTEVESSTVAAVGQPDLGFLLEASDDELGLPPPSSSPEDSISATAIAAGEENETDEVGFGQIWGVEEDNGFGFGSEFSIRPELVGGDNVVSNGVVFDGGLFDYGDVFIPATSDQFGLRSETLPAV